MTRIDLTRTIKKKIPALKWLPLYKAEDALGDLVAGLTVGLTLIPQVFLPNTHVVARSLEIFIITSKNQIFVIIGDSLRWISRIEAAIWTL